MRDGEKRSKGGRPGEMGDGERRQGGAGEEKKTKRKQWDPSGVLPLSAAVMIAPEAPLINTVVKICGTSQSDLNGQQGSVYAYSAANNRYKVLLAND
jgi:hypothetical protein